MNDDLGDLCKKMEREWSNIHPADQVIYIRLDGRSFSKYTRLMKKPEDYRRMTHIMKVITESLMNEFSCDLGFTQSDEISLVIIPKDSDFYNHPFGGKQQKLVSVMASTASAMMNSYFADGGTDHLATFDCRTLSCSVDEAKLHLLWRHQDAKRNAIQSICQYIAKSYNKGLHEFDEAAITEFMGTEEYPLHYLFKSGVITKLSLDGMKIETQKKLIEWSKFHVKHYVSAAFMNGTLISSLVGYGVTELYHPDKMYHLVDTIIKTSAKNLKI